MNLLAGLVLGGAAALTLWVGMQPVFSRPMFTRRNYRDVELPTAVGLVIPLAAVATSAALTMLTTLGWRPDRPGLAALGLTVTATLGFGLLGLLDDMAVDEDASGYRGHVRALLRGRLTAGSLKMVAGPAVAIIVVAPVSNDSAVRLVLDGALVALAANLANLFDRAPGRVTKVSLVMAALLVGLTGAAPELLGLAVVSGAALALLVPDLRERMMLGDAGANPLGATLGLAAVLTVSPAARNGILVVVLVLNLVSERVSFSRVIDRVAPLRVLDRAGRRRSGDA
jgi:UDP-N-acetylmuramyl pentapeptide phosphotransferase/UDP-N-acetylglucosamine-1-phosphate transferase